MDSKILIITNMTQQYQLLRRVQCDIPKIEVCMNDMGDEWSIEWEEKMLSANFILVTYMGTGLDTRFLREFVRFGKQNNIRYTMLIDDYMDDLFYNRVQREDILQLKKYIGFSGLQNYTNMIFWIANHFLDISIEYDLPKTLPVYGIWSYEDNKIYSSFLDYIKIYPTNGKRNVGILFYRGEWIGNNIDYLKFFAKCLEEQDLNPCFFFSHYAGDNLVDAPNLGETIRRLFSKEENSLWIDLLINFGKFSVIGLAAVTQEELKVFNIPLLQGYIMSDLVETWYENIQGMNAMDVNLGVTLPEFDGVIHGGVVSGKPMNKEGDWINIPVFERITALAKKQENGLIYDIKKCRKKGSDYFS